METVGFLEKSQQKLHLGKKPKVKVAQG